MKNNVFLDAAFAIALSVPKDSYHKRAVLLAEELEATQTHLVTTHGVMLEIGNALSKLRYRKASVQLLQSIEKDPVIRIIPVTEEIYNRAFQLYCNLPDKEWGLTDCVSFIVMQDLKITDALTTDDHFQQAGFRALLLE